LRVAVAAGLTLPQERGVTLLNPVDEVKHGLSKPELLLVQLGVSNPRKRPSFNAASACRRVHFSSVRSRSRTAA